MIEIEPLQTDFPSEEWLSNSDRIHEENRREMYHEIHRDGLIHTYGSVEEYLKNVVEYPRRIDERFS